MPTNDWKHVLFITDIITSLAEGTGDFAELRDELLRRIRAADFYNETDLVLRDIVTAMTAATTTQQLDQALTRLTIWGSLGQQVRLETEEPDELARRRNNLDSR